jgi:hypothetical protein
MSELRDKTSGFVDSLGDAARRNPLSAALIGMGVLWLFAAKSTGRVGDLVKSTGLDHLRESGPDTFSSATSHNRSVLEEAGSSFDAVRDKGVVVANAAAEFAQTPAADAFETARDNLTALFKAQPLALGAIGLAIGAGIAAAIPGTDLENSYLGEVSDTVRSKTAEMAGRQVDKASNLATRVIDVTAEEARKQGITAEGVKAAAGDFAARVGRVVEAAQSGIAPTSKDS